MKIKKLFIIPALIITMFVSGCSIELYKPSNNEQTPQSPESPRDNLAIHKINPSSYNGYINYFDGNSPILSSEEVYKKGVSSTVYIISKTMDASYGGSGVFFSEDDSDEGYAYLFTNAHVVEDAISIEIIYSNYKRDKAYLVGYHLLEDIAVLAVKKNDNYTIATINNTENLSPGHEVLAIGTPVSTDYNFTATKGIISKIDSPLSSRLDDSYTLLLLQIDAPLNHGNSGGPLFDMYGNLIGLNTVKLLYDESYKNIDDFNFSIPVERALFIANKIFNNKKYTRGLIGITSTDIIDISLAERSHYNISLNHGMYVSDVTDTGAANNILRPKDIITKINGIEFTHKTQFQKELFKYSKGETISLTIYRNNNYSTVNITLQ